MPAPTSETRILVTGAHGFLGRHVCERLRAGGYGNLIAPTRRDYDLTVESQVEALYRDTKPEVVLHLAGEVGGVAANRDHPGKFFFANLAMGLHLIEHARRAGVGKFVQISTLAAYPDRTAVPFQESELWEGYPSEVTAPYGVAKRALLTMLQAYRAEYGFKGVYLIPGNLYGPGDNFELGTSTVLPALIRKVIEAREAKAPTVTAWGTGAATREFLYVGDCAEAIVRAMERCEDPEPINLGSGQEISIRSLTELVCRVVGYGGEIVWDTSKPDGQARRCSDTSRAQERLGWMARTSLEDGIRATVDWYQSAGVRE